MTLEEAIEIKNKVREWFASGGKSGNKAYVAEGSDDPEFPDIDVDSPLVAKGQGGMSKLERRNHNQVIAASSIAQTRVKSDGRYSAVEYGEVLWRMKQPCGNCTEMAAVAAWMVSEKVAPQVYIALVTTDGCGDHVFCIVTKNTGLKWAAWAKLGAPPPAMNDVIVIDPWANVCCKLESFQTDFSATTAGWLKQGKRIAGGGDEWLAPDKHYVGKLFASTISITEARHSKLTLA